MIDLIELAGLWLGAGDRAALARTLGRLIEVLDARFPDDEDFRARFSALMDEVEGGAATEQLRRDYRRATLG